MENSRDTFGIYVDDKMGNLTICVGAKKQKNAQEKHMASFRMLQCRSAP